VIDVSFTWQIKHKTMIGWWGTKFIAMIVGVVYPSLESYKALKTESKDDDMQVKGFFLFGGVIFLLLHTNPSFCPKSGPLSARARGG